MTRRRPDSRGLVMPPGRSIPRSPAPKPPRPEPDPGLDVGAPDPVEKAAGELGSLAAAVRACEVCGRACDSRVVGSGYPRAPVFLVKDRPSAEDLREGCAFASEAEPLWRAFDALGIPLGWVYGTTAVRCGDGAAGLDEVKACATHLLVELEAVGPRVVVAFGPRAVDAVRMLDGRCGLAVPEEVSSGGPVGIRAGLSLLATEPLPAGVTERESKRRLWRHLQELPPLLR